MLTVSQQLPVAYYINVIIIIIIITIITLGILSYP